MKESQDCSACEDGFDDRQSPSPGSGAFESRDASWPHAAEPSGISVKRRKLSHVAVAGTAFPRSANWGWSPPLPPAQEALALLDLAIVGYEKAECFGQDLGYSFLRLDEFTIYRPDSTNRALEMITLDKLQNSFGCTIFHFDGIISCGGERRYVQNVPFSTLTVDGYGDRNVNDLGARICIRSRNAEKFNTWYQLGLPSSEYRRFHEPFLCLARFCKHFVDYLLEIDDVTLGHFRRHFSKWLRYRCKDETGFNSWRSQFKFSDFRTTVVAHVGFLWKECCSIDTREDGLCRHPIWHEVDPVRLEAIPQQPYQESKTVVTPFAYHCFQGMYFAGRLEERLIMESTVYRMVQERKARLNLTPLTAIGTHKRSPVIPMNPLDPRTLSTDDINPGDVVCVRPDEGSPWRSRGAVWYAYVQAIRSTTDSTVLDVIWLYEPADTTIGNAYYPFHNELFLSDNCSCGSEAIPMDCIVGKRSVQWFHRDPYKATGLFIRQKFRTVHDQDTYDFVTLQASDFRCGCQNRISLLQECANSYQVGETILVRQRNLIRGEDSLEPAQVIAFEFERQKVRLRRLIRKSESDKSARPNELILSDQLVYKDPSQIIRKCHVRFFDTNPGKPQIPSPYDRDGASDMFYIIGRPDESRSDDLGSGSRALPPIFQGWDPAETPPIPKLRGMGIFSGGGSFDRGLEDGGAVEFDYAIDYAPQALHTYRANSINTKMKYFLGSVDDYIAQAIAGSSEHHIAPIGQIDCISAGSPCPGFSDLQVNKQSLQSLTNASLVASVVSFVDLYNPLYCVLENVIAMTRGMGPDKGENVFAQILAAFVALGYQVQQFNMDSWSYGSAQQRSRVFIVATVPGVRPLLIPQHTHAHPNDIRIMQRSLGRSSNGLPFGLRRNDFTPFAHASALESVKDLPDIADSQPQLCLAFPDHRTPRDENSLSRTRIAVVPVLPHGSGLFQAQAMGLLSGEPLRFFHRQGDLRRSAYSKSYARVLPHGLFPTVVTSLIIEDGRVGRFVHWDQHRSLTVMELRRAQGFLDHEVIIGSPRDQVRIIGNSVDRKVALALGMSLRESWLQPTAWAKAGVVTVVRSLGQP